MKQFLARLIITFILCGAASAGTLDEVLSRGYLKCGVQAGHVGFAAPDTYGVWKGFDVDFCRAVAVAVLGNPELVMFISANRGVGVDSLAAGSADVVARSAQKLGAVGGPSARGVGVLLHDSYGFMSPVDGMVRDGTDLAGKTVCTTDVNGAAENLAQYLAKLSAPATVLRSANLNEPLARYSKGECEVIGALRSDLAGLRTRLRDPAQHRLLDAEIGKVPAGPRVRGDDGKWASVVEWVLFALIEAEELKLSRANVDAERNTSKSGRRVRQLLGSEGKIGAMLGLGPDWAYNIVKNVGNYAEVYARNLGPDSSLVLKRTRSRLWNAGGMLFAPPVVAR